MVQSLVLVALFASVLGQAQILAFDWDCSRAPACCNNACYLLYVYGTRRATLTYGGPGTSGDQRRRSGCSRRPCANNNLPYGQSGNTCDEYPYASTNEGGQGASLRCVPSGDQNREGADLSAFYSSFGNAAGQGFNVFINQYDGIPYCDNLSSQNDGFQFRLENGNFNTFKRNLDAKGLEFEDEQPQNVTMAPKRVFEDDEGVRHLLLGEADEGQVFEGMAMYSPAQDKWKTIVREVSDTI
ncbi:hypothetical protein KC315_g6250 [Hortaea werneckii]|nr:hypothetical protein KC315_g6250 [Hortaea werneckii]